MRMKDWMVTNSSYSGISNSKSKNKSNILQNNNTNGTICSTNTSCNSRPGVGGSPSAMTTAEKSAATATTKSAATTKVSSMSSPSLSKSTVSSVSLSSLRASSHTAKISSSSSLSTKTATALKSKSTSRTDRTTTSNNTGIGTKNVNKWMLIGVQHSFPYLKCPVVSVLVDGVEVERGGEVVYPTL